MVKSTSSSRRGRPVNEATRDAIIAEATRVFMEKGLHATTMESIARALSISKLTLYSRFPSKDALFTAVITAKCNEYIPDASMLDLSAQNPVDAFYEIGRRLMRLLTSQDAINMERMLMAEAQGKQKLVKLFYNAGPKRVKTLIADYLSQLHRQGIVYVPDAMLATHIFTSLIKGSDISLRMAMNIPPKPTKSEIEHYCRHAAEVFLKAYQPRATR